jgi:DNA-binding response OmpR family regulator
MKVFIADDENEHVFLLELFLRKWGYEDVFSTDNGEEALRELHGEDSPCIAILDWDMPGLNGLQVAETIKRTGKRNLYVLMLTARSQAVDRAKALQAGVHAFITKPYEPRELRATLLTACKELEGAGSPVA